MTPPDSQCGVREGTWSVEALAVAAQPLTWAGVGRRYPWALLGLENQAKIAWGVVGIALLFFGLPLARFLVDTTTRRESLRRFARLLLLLCPLLTAGLDVLSYRHVARFGYARPVPLLVLEAVVFLGVVLWLRRPRQPGVGAAFAAVAAAAHRAGAVALFPLAEQRSNMFAVLARAVGIWHAGGQPYVVGPGPQGLEYLPGTWLAVAPAVLLRLDPRILGSVIVLVTGLALARALRDPAGGSAARTPSLAELLTMLVLLNPYHAFRHELYFDAFLAMTAAIYYRVARGVETRRSFVAVAALVGLAVATRQWAWIYGPFVLLAGAVALASRRSSRGERADIRLGFGESVAGEFVLASSTSIVVAAVVIVPFLIQGPAAFWRGTFSHAGVSVSEACLGISALAASLGLSAVLVPAQIVLWVGGFGKACLAALRRRATPLSVLATSWLVWGAFVLLNPFMENYFYLSLGFAAASLSVGAQGAGKRDAER
jgi:hypothetical protein